MPPKDSRMKRPATGSDNKANSSGDSPASSDTKANVPKVRRSCRGQAGIQDLAERIVKGERIVFITGAGLSVASGIRAFRSHTATRTTAVPTKNGLLPTAGLWNDVIWTTATRKSFRKDPQKWYNDFWLPHFMGGSYEPNVGHTCMQEFLKRYKNVKQITQNVDGLQPSCESLIEAHGRVGLYKCLPESDSDTDSDSDDEEDRLVHLGHRRKSRLLIKELKCPMTCPYKYLLSLTPCQIVPDEVREMLLTPTASTVLPSAPLCPACNSSILPQALLFDEGYHSHSFYRFEEAENWLAQSHALVFVGTSFAVRLTHVALEHARDHAIPVYNFNLYDSLESNCRLNATNIIGPANETLQKLLDECNA
jgi:NAD-dependent SIR2 family protein deacetylase